MVRVTASRDAFAKTQMCPHLQLPGGCRRGSTCNFAHSPQEVRHKPDLRKTRLCDKYMQTGSCDRAATCEFAHGEKDLRSTDGYFKTDLCKYWKAGKCHAGPNCRHAHGYQDLRARKFKAEEIDALQRGAPMSEICLLRAQDLLHNGMDPNSDPFLRERAERDADILGVASISTPPPSARKVSVAASESRTVATTAASGAVNRANTLGPPPSTATLSSVASSTPALTAANGLLSAAASQYLAHPLSSRPSSTQPPVMFTQQSTGAVSRPSSALPSAAAANASSGSSAVAAPYMMNNGASQQDNYHSHLYGQMHHSSASQQQTNSPLYTNRFNYLIAPPPTAAQQALLETTPRVASPPIHPLHYHSHQHASASSLSANLDQPASPFAAAMREALLMSPSQPHHSHQASHGQLHSSANPALPFASTNAMGANWMSVHNTSPVANESSPSHHQSLLVALARVVANTPRALKSPSSHASSDNESSIALPPGIPSATAAPFGCWPPGYSPLHNAANSPTAALVQAVTSFQQALHHQNMIMAQMQQHQQSSAVELKTVPPAMSAMQPSVSLPPTDEEETEEKIENHEEKNTVSKVVEETA
eukprot:GDKJ01049066.1.p1 GENE.GDKJ01049066.1~~GDKJ01049066.1.p1  ORF type:complete len:594 (-),score=198.35 GDKJ01049066.1:1990-3771(-)